MSFYTSTGLNEKCSAIRRLWAWKQTKNPGKKPRAAAGSLAPICDRLNEIEKQIANIVPTTLQDCLAQLRLLKYRRACVPDELDEKPVDDMLAGLRRFPPAGDRRAPRRQRESPPLAGLFQMSGPCQNYLGLTLIAAAIIRLNSPETASLSPVA
jgi:hypothetical protein